MKWPVVVAACGGLVVADRWLKYLAAAGVRRDFGVAQFELFKNDALVFSWPSPGWLALVLMAVAMIAVAVLAVHLQRQHNMVAVGGATLVLIGAASNFYDRVVFGYVIDWAYFGRWWPVFNLADVLIAVGVLLMVFGRPRLTRTSG